MFIEKGYEHTSIQDILTASALSKGGLYHCFKSKEEILDVVMLKRANYIKTMLQDVEVFMGKTLWGVGSISTGAISLACNRLYARKYSKDKE